MKKGVYTTDKEELIKDYKSKPSERQEKRERQVKFEEKKKEKVELKQEVKIN